MTSQTIPQTIRRADRATQNKKVQISNSGQTIVSVATPPGRGAIGIVRLSGPDTRHIAGQITRRSPKQIKPHQAMYTGFYAADGSLIDKGILLLFPAPRSFTGEDIAEFHTHGNPLIQQNLTDRAISLGAKPAAPGEFSRRAYLNDKMDLSQAEALASLINSESELALRASMASLQGVFSEEVRQLDNELMQLRVYVEAALDFPDEDIDFLNDGEVDRQTRNLLNHLNKMHAEAQQGQQLTEETQLVILGKPNAGKSSLLNALCRQERSIVDAKAGTTRDFIRQSVRAGDRSFTLTDTAGIRTSVTAVEHKGIERSWHLAELADRILFIYDGRQPPGKSLIRELTDRGLLAKVLLIENKADLTDRRHCSFVVRIGAQNLPGVRLSAKTGKGLNALIKLLGKTEHTAPAYSARRRHLLALEQTRETIVKGYGVLKQQGAGEIFAEELKVARTILGEVIGKTDNEELLNKIFSEFCIGK